MELFIKKKQENLLSTFIHYRMQEKNNTDNTKKVK